MTKMKLSFLILALAALAPAIVEMKTVEELEKKMEELQGKVEKMEAILDTVLDKMEELSPAKDEESEMKRPIAGVEGGTEAATRRNDTEAELSIFFCNLNNHTGASILHHL